VPRTDSSGNSKKTRGFQAWQQNVFPAKSLIQRRFGQPGYWGKHLWCNARACSPGFR